jgi:hypothetical protein
MAIATTSQLELNKPDSTTLSWATTVNDSFDYVDAALAQTIAVTVTQSLTLTAAQARAAVLALTGTITAAAEVTFPRSGRWIVKNNLAFESATAHGYLLTLKRTAGDGGVGSVPGTRLDLIADDTNMVPASVSPEYLGRWSVSAATGLVIGGVSGGFTTAYQSLKLNVHDLWITGATGGEYDLTVRLNTTGGSDAGAVNYAHKTMVGHATSGTHADLSSSATSYIALVTGQTGSNDDGAFSGEITLVGAADTGIYKSLNFALQGLTVTGTAGSAVRTRVVGSGFYLANTSSLGHIAFGVHATATQISGNIDVYGSR